MINDIYTKKKVYTTKKIVVHNNLFKLYIQI